MKDAPRIFSISILFILFLCGCAGDDNGTVGNAASDVQEGVFIDSPVTGLRFRTPTQEGLTDAKGTFQYLEGEEVTFYIGRIEFGQAPAKPIMTPLDFTKGAVDENHPKVTNICKLLLTLDDDANPENGILITKDVRDNATDHISFDVSADSFQSDDSILQILEHLTSFTTAGQRGFVSTDFARTHFRRTLDGLSEKNSNDPDEDIDADNDGFEEGEDCDDSDPTVYPGALEICGDSIDQDCDSEDSPCEEVDDDVEWDIPENNDFDEDGYSPAEGDCDDQLATVFPGANDICGDGIDQNCDGLDEDCSDLTNIDGDEDGFSDDEGDCDDENASIHPGAQDICGDGVDQDCDGNDSICSGRDPDVGIPNASATDDDGDGFSEIAGDCNDDNAFINPSATDICGDGVDQDCSGSDAACPGAPNQTDDDGDGYDEAEGDCNDEDASINPGAMDICGDEVDQDCNGVDSECSPDNDEKVTICHKGKQTLEISASAVDAHLAHGDSMGACGDGESSKKVIVCHNGETLEISLAALPAHLAHGDTLGACVEEGGSDKVLVCHKGKTIEIARPALEAHLGHGDTLGSCEGDDGSDDDNDGVSGAEGDCDDSNASVYPGAPEICGDAIDQNCNGEDLPCLTDKFVLVNEDADFTESQNVMLTLLPETMPDFMQFSNDGETWSDWEVFESTKEWLILDNSPGAKTVYVRFETAGVISEPASDDILLMPKYGAEYAAEEVPAEMDRGISYPVTVTAQNTGFLVWDSDHPEFPVHLVYRFKDVYGNVVEEKGNYGMFMPLVENGESVGIPLMIRAPLQPGNYLLEIELEEWNTALFSEAGVEPLKTEVTVFDAELPERSVANVEEMPFGVGGLEVVSQSVPAVVTICKPSANILRLGADQTSLSIIYSAPYGRSIHNVYRAVKVNGYDFFQVDYSEYVNNTETLYISADDVGDSELCPEELVQFPGDRPCEQYYNDVGFGGTTGVDDVLCLDIAKATERGWISGNDTVYPDGRVEFDPSKRIIRIEFAKIIVEALGIEIQPHPEEPFFTDFEPYEDDGVTKKWFADYVYTAYQAGIMDTDENGNFGIVDEVAFSDAVAIAMRMFNFNINNPCGWEVLYPNDPYIGAALFYGVIEYDRIPLNPDDEKITKAYWVHMMVNAEAQKDNLSASPICPGDPVDGFDPVTTTMKICGQTAPVKLSSGMDLRGDLGLLTNGTSVEVVEDFSGIVEIEVIATGQTGFVSGTALVKDCAIPTPDEPLKEPEGNTVVVATPIGIFAHVAPSPIAAFADFNGDGTGSRADIVPYNTELTAIKRLGSWLYVGFEGADGIYKEGWIYDGFVIASSENSVVEVHDPKKMAVVSWAHGMTVDLRNVADFSLDAIIWEVYEGTRLQLLEKDPDLPFWRVKVDYTAKNLSIEGLEANYGRLYNTENLATLNDLQRGMAGWIHEDFLKIEGETYEQPFVYPFAYDPEGAVDDLVNQIFLEEVFGGAHRGVDYDLSAGTPVAAAQAGKIVKTVTNPSATGYGKVVVIEHADFYTHYAHLSEVLVEVGDTVDQGVLIGLSGGDGEFDAGSGLPHLEFGIYETLGLDLEGARNPSKWIVGYQMKDGDKCIKNQLVDAGVRIGHELAKICNFEGTGTGGEVSCFSDIQDSKYHYEICWAARKGWVQGFGGDREGEFGPHEELNRAQAIKIIIEAAIAAGILEQEKLDSFAQAGTRCFPDIEITEDPENDWFVKYVCYAKDLGIVQGYGNEDGECEQGTFCPDRKVKYIEFLKMVLEVFQFNYNSWQNNSDAWFDPYLRAAEYFGINIKTAKETIVNRDYAVFLLKNVFTACTSECMTGHVFPDEKLNNYADNEVSKLQSLLRCLGFFPNDQEISGYYGNITKDSVKEFQRAHNLDPTGLIDVKSLEILNRYSYSSANIISDSEDEKKAIAGISQFIRMNFDFGTEINDEDGFSNPKKISDLGKEWFNMLTVHQWCGGWVQDFSNITERNGKFYEDGILMFDSDKGIPFLVKGEIWEQYDCDIFGMPESNLTQEVSICGAEGYFQYFERYKAFKSNHGGLHLMDLRSEGGGKLLESFDQLGGVREFGWPKGVINERTANSSLRNKLNQMFPGEHTWTRALELDRAYFALDSELGVVLHEEKFYDCRDTIENIENCIIYINNNMDRDIVYIDEGLNGFEMPELQFKTSCYNSDGTPILWDLEMGGALPEGLGFNWEFSVNYFDDADRYVSYDQDLNVEIASVQHVVDDNNADRRRKGIETGDGFSKRHYSSSSHSHKWRVEWGDSFGGGYAAVRVRIGNKLFDGNLKLFRIAATEPSDEEKIAYLGSNALHAIARKETSNFKHLVESSRNPIVSFDGGFGLMQITNCNGLPNYQEIWSWKLNIDSGRRCFQTKMNAAGNYLDEIWGQGNYGEDELLKETFQRYNGGTYYIWSEEEQRVVENQNNSGYGYDVYSIYMQILEGRL